MTKYNIENGINNLEISKMLKAGFRLYIQNNNITIKSEKDLKEKLKEFEQINLGGE